MWAWDARLQFGVAGLLIAAIGTCRLWVVSRAWAILLISAYAINTLFAVTYNVGDPHVFFLPGHALTAVAIAALFADRRGLSKPLSIVATVVLLAYASWRAWDTWPSADRHGDRRVDALVARIAAGLTDANAVLLSDMDWQVENAVLYSARYERPQLAWRRAAEVLPHLPFLIHDNQTIGRDVVLAGSAAARVTMAYGPLFPVIPEFVPPSVADQAAAIPRGTPYVLVLLEPTSNERVDPDAFDAAVTMLAGPSAQKRTAARFQFWAGVAGERDAVYAQSDRPFRKTFAILGDPFSIRMEAWLPFETFRRAGFGHVLRGREHVLTVERGVSLLSFRPDGSPQIAYAAGLFAPKPRLRIPALVPQQVADSAGAILKAVSNRR
jgi:hypothetical protein